MLTNWQGAVVEAYAGFHAHQYKVLEERTRRSNVEIGEDGIKRRKATKYSAKKAD